MSLVKLADISPRLAALSASVLPIPGQHAATHSAHLADSALPILVSVDERVEILGTKTRPKRLWFRGSNGARYSFLLKVNYSSPLIFSSCYPFVLWYSSSPLFQDTFEGRHSCLRPCKAFACVLLLRTFLLICMIPSVLDACMLQYDTYLLWRNCLLYVSGRLKYE